MKSQVAIDFLIAIGVALSLFILLINTITAQERMRTEVVNRVDSKVLIENLAIAINSVYLAGEGSNRTIYIPESFEGGRSFTLRVYPKSIYLAYSGTQKIQATGILPAQIEGGSYIDVNPGKVIITFKENKLWVENV